MSLGIGKPRKGKRSGIVIVKKSVWCYRFAACNTQYQNKKVQLTLINRAMLFRYCMSTHWHSGVWSFHSKSQSLYSVALSSMQTKPFHLPFASRECVAMSSSAMPNRMELRLNRLNCGSRNATGNVLANEATHSPSAERCLQPVYTSPL